MLPEITLSDRLGNLVRYCEKYCVAECCGIDAFDFSPLHIASYLSAYTGRISETDLIEWAAELEKARASIEGLTPDEEGLVCSVAGMNQFFSQSDFLRFIEEIQHAINMSPRVLALSDQLRSQF